MKTIFLVRHAKSSWSTPSLEDFDRPLNKRGKRDAPLMGDILFKKNIFPQLIISSPALRAITTAEIIAEKLNYSVKDIIKNKNVYEASALDILEVIKKINNKIESIMIVGHNPGLTDLVNIISDKRLDNLPTSGIVCLKKDTNNWDKFDRGCSLDFFEYPKKYKL